MGKKLSKTHDMHLQISKDSSEEGNSPPKYINRSKLNLKNKNGTQKNSSEFEDYASCESSEIKQI